MLIHRSLTTLRDCFHNCIARRGSVSFVSDGVDWVISDIGVSLQKTLNKKFQFRMVSTPALLRNGIVHYGAVSALVRRGRPQFPHHSNKMILTWFHIEPDDARIQHIPEINARIDLVHTASTATATQLVIHGFDKHKVVVVPLGVDTTHFRPPTDEEKEDARNFFHIPKGRCVIGSFQKDGNGWGEGDTPKLIKGPDLFCDTVEALAKRFPIHVLLTGPARGYVKQRLSEKKIPFTHQYVEHARDMVQPYHALDLYLVTSRVEGGPMAVLESWATGVPLITTNVGMAMDCILDKVNGILVDVEDTARLVQSAEYLISHHDEAHILAQRARQDVSAYDWMHIAPQYASSLYVPLLSI